jgi:N-acylneuraminate cytidylyltransferase
VTDLPVFQHALRWLERHDGYRPELVVHLRPTSPARRPGLIDDAVARLRSDPTASSLRSVRPADHVPHKMWWITDDHLAPVAGTMAEEAFNEPRQSLPQAWVQDGVLDVIHTEVLLAGSMTGPRILALPLTRDESADVDRPEDIAVAEAALRRLADQAAGSAP